MKKTTSRVVSFLFAILLLLPIFGDAVHAIPAGGKEFVVENGVLTAYNGPGGDVVLPSGVKKIADHAFMKKSISKLTLNAELEEIGKYAFSDNAIKEVVFPDSVKKIDDYAFSDNLLESVAFSHVETVGEAAFKNNYIKTLTTGDELVSLGDSAFTSNRLKEVTFPDSFTTMGKGVFTDNQQYVKAVGKNVASEFVKDHFGHVANPITVTLSFVDKETKKEILSQKLLGNDLTKEGEVFSIGQTTTYAVPKINGYKAVSDTIAITPDAEPYKVTVEYENRKKEPTLTIPAKNFKAGDTIDKAKLLEGVVAKDLDGNDISSKVTVTPDHVDSVAGAYDVTYKVEDEYGNVATKTVKVGVGMNWPEVEVGKGWKIGDFTFNKNAVTGLSMQGKEKLNTNKDVVIPDINDKGENVDRIYQNSFRGLNASTVECQKGIKFIGNFAFSDSWMESFSADGVLMLTSSNVFSWCFNLRTVSFPALTTISGNNIFFNCRNLDSVSFPALTTISGDHTFSDSNNLTTVSLPTLTTISGSHTFRDCRGLAVISLPTLTTISGSHTFRNCRNLTTVSFPALTTISGKTIFLDCVNLTTVSFHALTTISGDYTFQNCVDLTTVSFPALTTVSGYNTFTNCHSLSIELHFPKLQKITGNKIFDSVNKFFSIYADPSVATFMRENYIFNPQSQTSDNDYVAGDFTYAKEGVVSGLTASGIAKLKGHDGKLVFPDNVKDIADYAFYKNSMITSIEGNALTTISGNVIFSGCNNLTTVSFPALITISGTSTFFNCHNLTTIFFPALTTISGSGTFSYCDNLTTISFSALTTISEHSTFSGCENLVTVSLPVLTEISEGYTFSGCENLVTVSLPVLTEISEGYTFSGCKKLKQLVINDAFDESRQTLQASMNGKDVSGVIVYTKNRTNPNHIQRKTDRYILNPTTLTIRYEDEKGQTLQAPMVVEKLMKSPYSITLPSFDGYKKPELSAIPFDVEKPEDEYTVVYHKLTDAELQQVSDQTKRIKFSQRLQNEKELPYTIGDPMTTRVSFDLSGFMTNLKNYTIELSVDPAYFDLDKTQVGKSSIVQSVTKTDKGIQIKLNSTYGGTSLDLPITWRFKKYVTPENTQMPVRASLKNTYGNLYALTDAVYLTGKYEKPVLKKKLVGLEDTGYYPADEVDMKEKVVTDKEILTYTFGFGIDHSTGQPKQLDRNVSSYVLTDTLPMYIDKSGKKVRARFDEKENPGWRLSSDGMSVSYEERVEPTHNLKLPPLKLHTPNAIFHSRIENKASITLTPALKPQIEDVMIASDSMNHYYRANVPRGDVFVKRIYMPHTGKIEGSSYFYDVQKERDLEFQWNIFWQYGKKYNSIDVGQLRTLVFEDYKLDKRMYYSGVITNKEFVGGVVSCVDSSGKTLLELNIDKAGTFAIPEIIGRNTTKLIFKKEGTNFAEGQHSMRVLTKLREPNKKQYSESSAIGVNTIENRLKMNMTFANGTTTSGDSFDDLGIRSLNQKVHLEKEGIVGKSKNLMPGMEETYTLSIKKDSEVIVDDLQEVEIVDLLPEPMEVKEVTLSNGFVKEPTHAYRIVENYNNTGRTAVIFTADRYSLENGNEIAKIKTVVREDMGKEGTYHNEAFLALGKGDVLIANPTNDSRVGAKNYSKAEVPHTFVKAKELIARKYVKKASDTVWSRSGIFTDSEEAFDYKLTIINNTDVEHKDTKIIDVLPFAGDTAIIENQEGKRISRGSEFANTFDTSRKIQVSAGYTVYYLNSKVPDLTGKVLDDIEGNWSWSKTPSAKTTAIKIVANAGTVLPANGRLDVIIPMKAPKNLDMSLSGKKAYNTFVRKDDITTSYIEPNRVYNEMTAPEGTIKLTKVGVSFTGKVNLAGAVFALRDDKGNYLGSKTSDVNGQVLFEHLSTVKDYMIEEVSAPDGYVKSDTKLTVKASDLMKATNHFIDLGEVKNSKPWVPLAEPKGQFLFKKVDGENKPLQGVLFSLVGKDNTPTAGLTYNRRSDADGIVSFTGLTPGSYTLTELSSVGSLQVVKPITVKVKGVLPNTSQKPSVEIDGVMYLTNDRNAANLYTVKNDKAAVTLLKLGVLDDKMDKSLSKFQTQDGVPLSDAVFALYKGSTLVKDDLKTDKDGKLILSDLTVNTDYMIKEKTAPTDYQIIHSSITFRVDTKGKLTIDGKEPLSSYLIVPNLKEKKLSLVTVKKTDGTNPVKDAKFTLYKKNGEAYELFSAEMTNDYGIAWFDNLTGGEYKLVETKAPAGYVRSEKEELFTVDDYTQKTFTFDVVNKPLSFDIKKVTYIAKNVSKEKADSIVLGNSTYKIEQNGSLYNVYEPLAGAIFALREEGSQTTLQTITSGADGIFAVDKTLIDSEKNYELVELQAPAGYDKLVNPVPLRLKDFAKLSDFTGKVVLSIENKPIRGQVVASKYDEAKKQKLVGVTFGLYNEKKEKVKDVKTNKVGNAIFTDLPLGTYYLKEEATLPGWRLPLDERKIVLTEANRSVAEVFYNKEQIPETGRNVLLYSAVGGVLLLGAYVVLRRKKKGVK